MRQNSEEKIGLSSFCLKCIAVSSMLVDHIGAFLFPSQLWLRCIGRLAFPIYCFLIAEGYFHTRNVWRYMARLAVFALVSEIPYDLAMFDMPFCAQSQNVYFTLLFGLACIYAIDGIRRERRWAGLAILAASAVLSHFFVRPDYGIGGIAMIVCFYVFRYSIPGRWLSVGAINIAYYGGVQSLGTLALVPIQFYNGRRGHGAKYFFYAFYPAHLLCIYLIRRYAFHVL